jgi:excisionase family DNA binding protein
MPVLADEPVVPTERDVQVASTVISELKAVKGKRFSKYKLASNNGKFEIELSEGTFELIVRILTEMAKGNGIMVIPIHAELTTQQAADFLNVSRPFIIGLLEKGEIPFRTVGRHRRIRLEDIVNYKKIVETKRLATLNELAAQAQELNMGYGT